MRNQTDSNFFLARTIPGNGQTLYSEPLFFGAGPVTVEIFEVSVTIPQLFMLNDGKSVAVDLEQSSDGVNFEHIQELGPLVVTASGNLGSERKTQNYRLPSNALPYLRLKIRADSDSWNNGDYSFSEYAVILKLLF